MMRFILAAVLAYSVHCAAVVWQFPLVYRSLDRPLASGDLGITLSKAWDFSRTPGHFGYSPSYMAGYPIGYWNSVGHRGYELGTRYLPLGNPVANYHGTIVLMCLLSPVIIALASRAAGVSWRMTLGVLIGSCFFIQLCDPISYFWTFGNAGFVFGSSLAVLATCLAFPRCGQISLLRVVGCGVVGGIAIVIHTVAVIPLATGALAALILARLEGVSIIRIVVSVAVVCLVSAAVSLPFYYPLFSMLDQRAPMPIKPLQSGIKYLIMDLLNDRAFRQPMDRRGFFHLLLVFGGYGALSGWRTKQFAALGLFLAGLFVLGFGYACGHVSFLKELQPYRFVVSGELFLIGAACCGIVHAYQLWKNLETAGRSLVILLTLLYVPVLSGHFIELASRQRSTGIEDDALKVVKVLRELPIQGRILCESGGLGGFIPQMTGHPVIGSSVSGQSVLIQNWAHIAPGQYFGKPLSEWKNVDLIRLLRNLDVQLVIVESAELNEFANRNGADFTLFQQVGKYSIYRLRSGPCDIWKGTVVADHSRIKLIDPPTGRIVIPYHSVRGFQADGTVQIDAEIIPFARAPFIAITIQEKRSELNLVFKP